MVVVDVADTAIHRVVDARSDGVIVYVNPVRVVHRARFADFGLISALDLSV